MMNSKIEQTVALLKELQPGFLPFPIFEQIARLVALPIVEFIPLRYTVQGSVEVLLIQRPSDDKLFSGMLHTPGTVVRADDKSKGRQNNRSAFERICEDELFGVELSQPYFVGSIFHDSKRGAEQAQLYWVEVYNESPVGEFWPVESLPANLIESQYDFIHEAVRNFRAFKQLQSD